MAAVAGARKTGCSSPSGGGLSLGTSTRRARDRRALRQRPRGNRHAPAQPRRHARRVAPRRAAALFATDPNLVDALPSSGSSSITSTIRTQFQGIQGIGYAVRLLPRRACPTLEGLMRADGRPGLRSAAAGAAAGDTLDVILYLEPVDPRNARAIPGFTMSSEPNRRAGDETARRGKRDAGRIRARRHARAGRGRAGRRTARPAFLIYLPVYRGGVPPQATEAARLAALQGIRVRSVSRRQICSGQLPGSRRSRAPGVRPPGVRRPTRRTPTTLLYDSVGRPRGGVAPQPSRRSKRLTVYGRAVARGVGGAAGVP